MTNTGKHPGKASIAGKIGAAGVSVGAALLSSAAKWVSPDSASTGVYILLYLSHRFWPELVGVAVIFGLFALPQSVTRRARRAIAREVSAAKRDFLTIRSANLDQMLRLFSYLIVFAGLGLCGIHLYEPVLHLVRVRAALALDNSSSDFMMYMSARAREKITRLDFDGAHGYYSTIVSMYGEGERTAEVRSEIHVLGKFKALGAASAQRAADLERTNGPNRTSLYLYANALVLIPEAPAVREHLVDYEALAREIEDVNSYFKARCSGSPISSARPPHLEGASKITQFAASTFSRDFLNQAMSKAAGDNEAFSKATSQICHYSDVYGALFSLDGDDAVGIQKIIGAFDDAKEHGVHLSSDE